MKADLLAKIKICDGNLNTFVYAKTSDLWTIKFVNYQWK